MKSNGQGYDTNNNIIYELKKGKGYVKEYENNDILVFEGEYINGVRNGKGKEYDKLSGRLIYDGEYSNGLRNGKGKDYYYDIFKGKYIYGHRLTGKRYINDILEFEGDYLYDKNWNGKGYDKNGNVIYELINGKGKIKEYDIKGNIIFEEEYLNGQKNGKGKEYDYKGNIIFER